MFERGEIKDCSTEVTLNVTVADVKSCDMAGCFVARHSLPAMATVSSGLPRSKIRVEEASFELEKGRALVRMA